MKRKILIIDDEEHILELLKVNLEFSGYETHTYETGKGALELIAKIEPDLILLDLMLPEIDGIEICKKIRKNSKFNKIKLLILSAKSDEIDKILCLEIGADDYITKPFSLRELLARIKAIFRRENYEYDNISQVQSLEKKKKTKELKEKVIYYKDLKVNLEKGEIYKGTLKLNLTTKEFKLFTFLLSHKGEVLLRENIIEQVWKFDSGNSRSLDVHIRKLRMKLGDNNNYYLETIRGIGYMVPLE